MSEAVISFFQHLNLSDELLVFIVSMLPIVELRGAIPLGVVLGMNSWELLGLALLGNMLPIPFIIFCARPIVNYFLKTKLFRPIGNWLEEKVRKHSDKVLKYEVWGLFLFVAIPLPGTGAWTGALVAAMMEMRLKDALPAIFVGVVVAAIIVAMVTCGVSFIIF